MAVVLDQINLFNFVAFGNAGRYSGSVNITETSYDALSNIGFNSTNSGKFNSAEKVTTTFNTYYKMRGYNPITEEYEYWHCMGEPLLTSPQGDSLINITILDVWQDR